jgi:hypothetical protein
MITRVSTIHGVCVDSVFSNVWESYKDGIQEISETDSGVSINWNQGCTFVPWSNVRYTQEV